VKITWHPEAEMKIDAVLVVMGVVVVAALLVLLWAVRKIQRKSRVLSDSPFLWEGRSYFCLQCNAPMEPGWVMLGRGAIWSSRNSGKPGIFAHIGSALENTVSLSVPPAANMAWRCPSCRLLLVDYDKLVGSNKGSG
jgi:hypothetical protein